MALIPIQQPEKKGSGGKLGGILGAVGAGLGGVVGSVVPGAGTAAGMAIGGALGGTAGNIIDPAKGPDGSKLNSMTGDIASTALTVAKAKAAANSDPKIPEPTRIDLNKHFDDTLAVLQNRYKMGGQLASDPNSLSSMQGQYGMGKSRLRGNF